MSGNYKKANLKAHLESIMPGGFTINEPKSNEDFVFKLETENHDRIYELLLIDTTDFPIDVNFLGVLNLSVSFKKVEDLVKYACEITEGDPFDYDEDDFTFEVIFQPDGGHDETMKIWKNSVSDDESFERIRQDLEKLITKAINFISEHQTLESWYLYLESFSTLEEKVDTVMSPYPVRNMIFKKLLNQSDYETYANGLITSYHSKGNFKLEAFLQVLKDKLDTLPTNYLES